MRFEILTLFPETFEGFLKASLIGKAIAKRLLEVHLHNIRDHAINKREADDRPYGGGPGMVLKAEPIYQTLQFIQKNCLKTPLRSKKEKKSAAWVLSPRGIPLTPKWAKQMAAQKTLVLLAGHYEGIDERALRFFDGEISIGNYVTMGGETPAMVVMEAVGRFLPGVLGDSASLEYESFSIPPANPRKNKKERLEWPQYTRPKNWRNMKVPQVLLNGDHKQIRNWRLNHTTACPNSKVG